MYVVGLDRSWLQTPFIFHHKLIKGDDDIAIFERHGVREVFIDTARGVDIAEALSEIRPADAMHTPTEASPVDGAGAVVNKLAARAPSAAEAVLQPLTMELRAARVLHNEALAVAQNMFDGAALGGGPVKSEGAKKVVTDLMSSIARSPEANLLLMQMRRFQKDLFSHAVNVCVLSLVVGVLEDFDIDVAGLGVGALLHDIGETRLPRNLIRKKDGFTNAERRLVEQHPMLGAMLLEQNLDLAPCARQIVLEHHERIDGSGYPLGVRAGNLSLAGQIVAITDAYDEMLSGRNQAVLQPVEVLRQLFMQSNAGALDRELVERIIRCLGVYPIGSLVELNTGERGIVVAANRTDTLKPTLRIVMSSNGLIHSSGPIVSLADTKSGAPERRIVGSLDPGKERIDPMAFLKLAPAAAG
jgi:HD-GYP domain-containing protein (c-di-GMP phosphodiesterase class II)